MALVLTILATIAPTAPQPCQTSSCEQRVRVRMMRRVVRPYLPWLNATGRCESGNDPWKNTGNGFYGEHQWTLQTWRSVGGRGMPNEASRLRQRFLAVRLVKRAGPGPWPVCGVRNAGLLPR